MEKYIDTFNKLVINLVEYLQSFIITHNFNNYIEEIINNILKHDKYELIELFILKIYNVQEYRHDILNLHDDIYIDKLGKDIWNKLNDDTKLFIKNTMKALCITCKKIIKHIN